jgi:hypothetical protein
MRSFVAPPGDSAAGFVVAAAGVEGCWTSIPKPWPKSCARRWLIVEHVDIGVDGESDLTLVQTPLGVADASQEQVVGLEAGFVLYLTTSGSVGKPMTVS